MIKEAIDRILQLAGPKTVEVEGLTYSGRADGSLSLVAPPAIGTIEATTLTAICDYFKNNIERIKDGDVFLHVVGPAEVSVIIAADLKFRRRQQPITAKAIVNKFKYDQWLSISEFIPAVQSMFADGGDKSEVLKYAGNITHESSVNVADDGVTQRVQAKTGVARREDVALPSVVTLCPYETFTEIIQPERKFVFRVQRTDKDFSCKLIPADGEQWKTAVKQDISAYLQANIAGLRVIS